MLSTDPRLAGLAGRTTAQLAFVIPKDGAPHIANGKLRVGEIGEARAAPDVAARDPSRAPTLTRRQDSANPNAGNNDDGVVTLTTVVPEPTDDSNDQQNDPVTTVVVAPPKPTNKPTQTSSPDKKDDGDSTNVTVIIVVVVVVVVVVAVAVGILVFRKWKLRKQRKEQMKEALPQNFFSRTQETDAMFLRQLNE
ncbi:hypothetical protein H4R35_000278 [Dimargaris xerosporica]|nr:hypothetical protein H4R35_000278 [Dimargaris xerosporica]